MLTKSQEQLLVAGAQQFGLHLTEQDLILFAHFIEEIQRWSKIADLLSQTDPDTLIRKHILDSLALLSCIPTGSRVLDLGSGAGFPGLPLAIANQNLSITLIETRRKRANFLKESTRRLGLHNAKAYEGRAEELAQKNELQGVFDIVTTRATWNIALFLRLADPFLRYKGTAMTMKGPKFQKELQEMREQIEKTTFLHSDTKTYLLSGNEKRTIAIFTKISSIENVSRKTSQ